MFLQGQGDGGTPRAGGNRRTKEEERRKELNRQRDEAKAKRALEAVRFSSVTKLNLWVNVGSLIAANVRSPSPV